MLVDEEEEAVDPLAGVEAVDTPSLLPDLEQEDESRNDPQVIEVNHGHFPVILASDSPSLLLPDQEQEDESRNDPQVIEVNHGHFPFILVI